MNKHKGFSLLEILVAFSIMSISLGILLRIFSSGLNTAMVAEEYTVATQIAESLMARNGIEEPLNIGEISGVEEEKYHWRVTVENYVNPATEDETELMTVQVYVDWGNNQLNNRAVELNTIKFGPK